MECAMEHGFWLEKWQKNETGFHLEDVNTSLVAAWPLLKVESGRVLVPLCGKSRDIFWLLQQGYEVVGIELSPLALQALRADIHQMSGWTFEASNEEGLTLYHHPCITLIEGDFFAVTAGQCGQIDAVYDRAAMVALPDTMREHYRQQVLALSANAPQLLITLDYDQTVAGGPPFAVSDAEVKRGYERFFTIECQDERELIDQEPRFRNKGLNSFVQRTYLLQPQTGS
jgi:thiopurine S-methyltransferase